MERGGGALRSNLSCWPLFSRSGALGETRRRHRTSLSGSAELLLVKHLRSYICSRGEGYLIMQKALHKPHTSLRAFNSCGPKEASLNCEDMPKDKFLIDCGSDQECVIGGIVALGKFDALHIGHRELAIQASKAGIPFLLSFVGMAEVLGWESRFCIQWEEVGIRGIQGATPWFEDSVEPGTNSSKRAPIVAKSDRKRVLSSWAPYCGNVVPLEFQVDFSNVRHLTPRQFVERLSKELRVSGVVAGENYRFGYKASGDASELVRLCREYDMSAYIVNPVMDKTRRSWNGVGRSINSSDRGQVSSSRVRHALALGDMECVAELLGRKHRLVLEVDERSLCSNGRISAPSSCVQNQPPTDGTYDRCTLLVGDALFEPCRVVLDGETIDIELDGGSFSAHDLVLEDRLVGIEFG